MAAGVDPDSRTGTKQHGADDGFEIWRGKSWKALSRSHCHSHNSSEA